MEYMMVRTVKAGGKPPDSLTKSSLGIVSADHHLTRHHPPPLPHHQVVVHQVQTTAAQPQVVMHQVPQPVVDLYATTVSQNSNPPAGVHSTISTSARLTHHHPPSTQGLQISNDRMTTSSVGSSGLTFNSLRGPQLAQNRQKPGSPRIPIQFKSKDIYERMVASSSVSSSVWSPTKSRTFPQTSSPSPSVTSFNKRQVFVNAQKQAAALFKRTSSGPPSNAPQLLSSAGGRSGPSVPNNWKKVRTGGDSVVKSESGESLLWESSTRANGMLLKVDQTVNNAPSSAPPKRKRNEFQTAFHQLLLQKRPRLANGLGQELGVGGGMTAQMPNLLKAWRPEAARLRSGGNSSTATSITDFLTSPTKSTAESSTGICDTSLTSRLPMENIFLKKYDPIKLLARLKQSGSRRSSMITKKKVIFGDHFPKRRFRGKRPLKTTTVTSKKKDSSQVKGKAAASSGRKRITKGRRQRRKRPWRKLAKPVGKTRRLRVKFTTAPSGTSEKRLRVAAAVRLKRAMKRVRGKVKRTSGPPKAARNSKGSAVQATGDNQKHVNRFHVVENNFAAIQPLQISAFKVKVGENAYLSHTIELLRHKRELQDRLEGVDADAGTSKLGAHPERPEEVGGGKAPLLTQSVPLSGRQVKQVISQRVLLSLAHSGFTHAKLRPLEVMADVMSNFLAEMAQRLKQISEVEMLGADHGFPDPMERALNEVGMGGIRGLDDFYRSRVVEHGHRMEEQCHLMRRQIAYKVRSKVGLGGGVGGGGGSSPSTTSTHHHHPHHHLYHSSSSSTSVGSPTTVGGGPATPGPQCPHLSNGAASGNNGRPVISASKTASTTTSSSQPLSPGNSVLAEMLSSQEDSPARTPLGLALSPQVGLGERQLEELMMGAAPPPNVEIRPNNSSSFSLHPLHLHHPTVQQQQLLPVRRLRASLPQQSQQLHHQLQQQQPAQSVLPLIHPVGAAGNSPSGSASPAVLQHHHPQQNFAHQPPPLLAQKAGSQQPGVVQQQHLPPPPPPHLGGTSPAYTLPSSSPVVHQPHLTQLLQRPIIATKPPQAQPIASPLGLQEPPSPYQATSTTLAPPPPPSPQSQGAAGAVVGARSISINNSIAPPPPRPGMMSLPIQISLSKPPGPSTPTSTTPPATFTSLPLSQSLLKTSTNKQGRTLTIIRSTPTSISNSNSITGGVDSDLSANNVISIDLGGGDLSSGGGGTFPSSVTIPQTVTMHAADSGMTLTTSASSHQPSSKAKLKETLNQRNLLRLNFEQMPNAGDSTVLLSSSTAAVANAGAGVQFLGKVTSSSSSSGGQTISWNASNNCP